MKKICLECKTQYANINFCPNCGKKLDILKENKIDVGENIIDEKIIFLNQKKDELISIINNELSSSVAVQSAKESSKKILDLFIVTIGIFGVVTLLVQLFSALMTGEPSPLYQVIHPKPNEYYYSDIYNSDIISKIGFVFPGIILPCLAIIITSIKRPYFFLALIIVLILINN